MDVLGVVLLDVVLLDVVVLGVVMLGVVVLGVVVHLKISGFGGFHLVFTWVFNSSFSK